MFEESSTLVASCKVCKLFNILTESIRYHIYLVVATFLNMYEHVEIVFELIMPLDTDVVTKDAKPVILS